MTAECQYLYPLVRRVLYDGDFLAAAAATHHTTVYELTEQLEKIDPADPAFTTTVTRLTREVREHIQAEEEHLLPRLRMMCPASELDDLAVALTDTVERPNRRKTTPNRAAAASVTHMPSGVPGIRVGRSEADS